MKTNFKILLLTACFMIAAGTAKPQVPSKVFIEFGDPHFSWVHRCFAEYNIFSLDGSSWQFCGDRIENMEIAVASFNKPLKLGSWDGYSWHYSNFMAIPGESTNVYVVKNGPDCYNDAFNVEATVFGAYFIKNITSPSCLSSGSSITIETDVSFPHSLSRKILKIARLDNPSVSIYEREITLEPEIFSLALYDILNNGNHWNKDLVFSITSKLKFGTCEINTIYKILNFSKQIPPASIDNVFRSACRKDEITILADASIINEVSNYDFTLSEMNQAFANPIILTPDRIASGNKIVLVPKTGFSIPDNASEYELQIAYSGTSSPDAPCAYTIRNIQIPQKPDPIISSVAQIRHLLCHGDNSGSVTLTASGGRQPYSVSADNLNWVAGLSIGGLPAGASMKIYLKDADNCTVENEVTINQPNLLIAGVNNVENLTCYGDNTGKVTLNIQGGTSPYSLSVDQLNWISGNMISGLPASSSLTIHVRDLNNCQTSVTATLTQPPDISVNALIEHPICNGSTDGSIQLTVAGGAGGFQYLWNTGSTASGLAGLSSGTYSVRVTDSNGCIKVQGYSLSEPDPILINFSVTEPTCHDSADGSILATVSGGPSINGPYTYLWNTNDVTPGISGLSKGTYQLQVRDSHTCTGSKSVVLNAPPPPSPGWERNDAVICTGTSLTLDGGDFQAYLWYTVQGTLSQNRYLSINKAGTYFLKLTDVKGCIGVESFSLTVLETPVEAELLLADSARVNEVIRVIDVTWPVPDSIKWFFDKPVTLHEQNSWSAYFSSSLTGLIHVTLRAWYGGCYSDSTKTVYVFNDGKKFEIFTPEREYLIRGFFLYPNPNSGYFTAEVKLSRQSDIMLYLYGASNSIAMSSKKYFGEEHYLIEFSKPGLKSGVYLLILQAGQERQVMRFVVH